MLFVLSFLATIVAHAQAEDLLVESNGKLMRKELEVKKSHASARLKGKQSNHEDELFSESNVSVHSSEYLPFNFADAPAPAATIIPPSTEDIFDIANEHNLTCNGNWNHYFLDHTPMTYRHCSNRAREVPECIGFDWGFDTCRLFTQKAVDTRRWKVQFNLTTGGPFGGNGTYVEKTSQLGELAEEIKEETEQHGCYLRKNPLEADAHYRKLGEGSCIAQSGETLKHYAATVEDRAECEDACNKVDECIAIDFDGDSGSVSDDSLTQPSDSGTCKLYTQKTVSNWHDLTVTHADGGSNAVFAIDTHMLRAASSVPEANCSVKREYYPVEDYYIKQGGSGLCQDWNHYKLTAADVQDCEHKCDEQHECVGFDFDGSACRLFVTKPTDSYGTVADGSAPFEKFAGDPDKLHGVGDPNAAVDADASLGCYKKNHYQTFDSFELVGPNRCNGGGQWNYYQLCKAAASYVDCSNACLGKDSCTGFDVGQGVCFLYTQYAAAEGSWPDVCFDNGGPFIGGKVTGAHPENAHLYIREGYPTHNELNMEGRNASEDHNYHCYKKKIVPARDARYSNAGLGTCSEGGLWARYNLVPASDEWNLTHLTRDEACAVCFDACNKKDECVGLDCGSWFVEDESAQLNQSEVQNTRDTKFGCNMYSQKPIWDWHLVEAEHSGHNPRPMEGTGTHEDMRPVDPRDLVALSGVYTRYEEKGDTECWQKNAWVPLDEYYVKIAGRQCATLRHYKFSKAGFTKDGAPEHNLVAACKEKCDMWVSCVGLDVGDTDECRLFTSHTVTGVWEEVTTDEVELAGKNTSRAFLGLPAESGKADADHFAESGNDLGRRHGDALPVGDCFVKTHWHSRIEALDEGDSR